MKTLTQNSTMDDIQDFLLYHMDNADERASKINPSLTKKDIWDLNMGVVLKESIIRVSNIIVKNLTREFGIYYE